MPLKSRSEDVRLMDSIKVHEVKVPVVVDSKYNLIDGLSRIRAAKECGLETIPGIVLERTQWWKS